MPYGFLHRGRIELAIGLGAGSTNRRTFAPVQNAELDAALIGDPAHEAVQSIDFADQMTLSQAAYRGIAGHGTDGRKPVRDQRRPGPHAGRSGCGLTTGVAAADHNDVESGLHGVLCSGLVADHHYRVKKSSMESKCFT